MKIALNFITVLITAVVALVIYNFAKPFIFNKIKPNKWITLILLVVIFFIPLLLPQVYANIIVSSIFFVVITTLALTFMDILRLEKAQKNQPVVGKPKAKPKRANKHTN